MIATDRTEGRTVGWFSCGAASAVSMMLEKPELIAYCDTGSEHVDNHRFMLDCEKWFDQEVTILRGEYPDTWSVWEHKKYISGIAGAPCTGLLKVAPRLAMQRPDDIHIFGYTADSGDMQRAENMREHYPDLGLKFPLIERGITKAGCLAMIQNAGIEPPLTYALGMANANCIPCCKATSPNYWALIRKEFPAEFDRMTELSRRLGARLARVKGERVFIDEVPMDQPVTEAIAPACDFLCSLAEEDMLEAAK